MCSSEGLHAGTSWWLSCNVELVFIDNMKKYHSRGEISGEIVNRMCTWRTPLREITPIEIVAIKREGYRVAAWRYRYLWRKKKYVTEWDIRQAIHKLTLIISPMLAWVEADIEMISSFQWNKHMAESDTWMKSSLAERQSGRLIKKIWKFLSWR